VEDIKALIEWNEAHGIKFMRISSEIFPFASHDDHGYSLEFAAKELKEVGDLAAKYNHRLTTHPGQYNQLGSPNPEVVRRTVKDLGCKYIRYLPRILHHSCHLYNRSRRDAGFDGAAGRFHYDHVRNYHRSSI
jgi:UV DNA damage repair endonuclease